jgi:uncharacterized protein YgiM (DUF1202 family)
MRRSFAIVTMIVALASLFALGISSAGAGSPALQLPTETLRASPTIGNAVVQALEQVNVRSGPGTDYDLIGVLIANQQAVALGRSPGGTWIQIVYDGGVDNTGWVFGDLVNLNGVTREQLPTVQAPPTPTLEPTATLGPGAGGPIVTSAPTSLPTYTPPPPYVEPTHFPETGGGERTGFPPALLIIGLFSVGLLGLVGAFVSGRR